MPLVESPDHARRLARTIVSDIALYNAAKIKEGIEHDDIFEILKEELEEGRKLYLSRVSPSIADEHHFFEQAIVDVLIKPAGRIKSKIW
jgi:spore germination protein GerM